MDDFWASGADGVTVRRVTLFVVVFRMAGGLPSRALVATGELDRSVFIVAVLATGSAGGASRVRGCRRVSLALRRAPAGLPSGGGCRRVSRARRIRRRRVLGGHLEPRAGCWGLPKAAGGCLPANSGPTAATRAGLLFVNQAGMRALYGFWGRTKRWGASWGSKLPTRRLRSRQRGPYSP